MAHSIKKWITNEVLPTIRKTGCYSSQPTKPVYDTINPFGFKNENEMEFAFNFLIKKHFPDIPRSVGVGELFKYFPEGKKVGYQRGSPDLTFNVKNEHYNALKLEFKNPNTGGVQSDEQKNQQAIAEAFGNKYVCSPDIVDMLKTTVDYMSTAEKPKCPYCKDPNHFKTIDSLKKHCIIIHKKGFHYQR